MLSLDRLWLAATEPAAIYVKDALLMTRRQMKGVAIAVLGLLALAAVIWLLRRMLASRSAAPAEAAPPPVPRERPVDAAVANLLEQAAPLAGDTRSAEDLYIEAVRHVVAIGGVSIPGLQRKLHVDFDTAHALVARMEHEKLVTAASAGKRKVLPAAQTFVDQSPEPV
jgi:DNA segregation ATPase FtsK/SpoIIIE-like protein